jgi:hypothetical protein
MELRIGQIVYALALNETTRKIEYIGCGYYLGKKCYSLDLALPDTTNGRMIIPTVFSNADYLIPRDVKDFEASNSHELILMDVHIRDYSTKKPIKDIPSEHLSDYDWWKEIEEKVKLETETQYYKNKYG